jgi:hypothetical protein
LWTDFQPPTASHGDPNLSIIQSHFEAPTSGEDHPAEEKGPPSTLMLLRWRLHVLGTYNSFRRPKGESCGGKKRRFTPPALCYLGVGVSTVRLRVLETAGQSHPRVSSTRALKSSYPTALVTASIRLKATESWLPKCRSNSGVLNTRNSQASMSSGSRRVGSRSA